MTRRRLRAVLAVAGSLAVAAAGDSAAILGIPPSYGPPTLSALPNSAAVATRIWMPGLDAGYDPQGLTVVDGSLMVAAYRSDGLRQNRGPCRVFRVDPASGHETGHFDVPAPCGHAGGLAFAGDGILYVADTRALFAVDLASAFGAGPPLVQTHPLGPGLTGSLAASDRDGIWIGSYETRGPGRIFKFESGALRALRHNEPLLAEMAVRQVAIPAYAQGAAIDPNGQLLWVARSAVGWGAVDTVDLKSGAVIQRHAALPGLEGIAFDAADRLWGVSEAGARHVYDHPLARLISPFHPIILDLGATLRPD